MGDEEGKKIENLGWQSGIYFKVARLAQHLKINILKMQHIKGAKKEKSDGH